MTGPPTATSGSVVLGPPRSSQSLVAAAVGQHPDVRLVSDATWVLGLGRSVVAATGVAAPACRPARSAPAAAAAAAAAGAAACGLLGTGAGPWVTSMVVAGPADVALAAAMFPAATLVSVVRHPDATVESLATKACGDGAYLSRPAGYRVWLDAHAALDAAAAAWPERVVVLDLAGVHPDPEATLGPCLARIGASWDPMCAAVLDAVTAEDDLRAAAEAHVATSGRVPGREAALARHAAATTGRRVPADPDGASRSLADALDGLATGARAPAATTASGRYASFVSLALPEGATAAVISKGDPALVAVPDRDLVHLPADGTGAYLGHHPANGAEAVAALTRAAVGGAGHLVVPAASSWWLSHYGELAEHLARRARLIAHHDDIATVYELT